MYGETSAGRGEGSSAFVTTLPDGGWCLPCVCQCACFRVCDMQSRNAQVCPLHLTLAATDGAPCELTGNTTARPYHSDY